MEEIADKIIKQPDPRKLTFMRAFKVWFFTMLTGLLWIFLLPWEFPKGDEWWIVPQTFVLALFFSLPVLFMAIAVIRVCSVVKEKASKALLLFLLTLLLNLIVYFAVAQMFRITENDMKSFLLPFTVSSLLLMFIVNRDWFWKKARSVNIENEQT